MNPLRSLWSDLVEKRLWPVAVLLLAALVAVPLVLARSPAEAPQAETPVAAAKAAAASSAVAAAAAEPAVSIDPKPASGGAPLRGHAKDPFKQQHVPAKSATADGGGTAPVTTPTPDGGTTSPAGGGSAGGATPTQPERPQKTYAVVSVDVRFGKASGPQRTRDDVPRLAALPSAANAVAIFLGMRKDLRTAVFLISSDVHAQGDGTCTPSLDECTAVELKEGDVLLLDVTGSDGRVRQYELSLVKVTVTHTTSKTEAQEDYAHVSRGGARLLARRVRVSARNTAAGGHADRLRLPYRYAVARGVLHIAPFMSHRIAGRHRVSAP